MENSEMKLRKFLLSIEAELDDIKKYWDNPYRKYHSICDGNICSTCPINDVINKNKKELVVLKPLCPRISNHSRKVSKKTLRKRNMILYMYLLSLREFYQSELGKFYEFNVGDCVRYNHNDEEYIIVGITKYGASDICLLTHNKNEYDKYISDVMSRDVGSVEKPSIINFKPYMVTKVIPTQEEKKDMKIGKIGISGFREVIPGVPHINDLDELNRFFELHPLPPKDSQEHSKEETPKTEMDVLKEELESYKRLLKLKETMIKTFSTSIGSHIENLTREASNDALETYINKDSIYDILNIGDNPEAIDDVNKILIMISKIKLYKEVLTQLTKILDAG